jgi:hypothetical protein
VFKRRPRGTSKSTTSRYRSSLEEGIALGLEAQGVPFSYESKVLDYTVPATVHRYTPDFILGDIIIEAKGYLTSEDRSKMKLVKASNPDLDIRFVFQRASNRLNKKSSTTYADWAEKYGFKWAEKFVPLEWIKEKTLVPSDK